MSYKKTTDYEFIQRFFEFELNDEEVILFEQRLETDLQFLKKVKSYGFIDDKINKDFTAIAFEEKQVQEQQLQQELKKKTATIKRLKPTKTWWTMAASFTLLLVASSFWMWNMSVSSTSSEQVALNNWKDTYPAFTKRSNTQNVYNEALSNAVERYKAGKYEACLQLLKADSSPEALLLKGQAHFKLNAYEAAQNTFQRIIDMEDGGGKDMAYWYQALVYLSVENIGAAKGNLKTIIDNNYPLEADAKILLQKLKH